MLRTGRLHRNERGRVCFGPERANAPEVVKPRDRTLKEVVEQSDIGGNTGRPTQAGIRHITVCDAPSDSEEELPFSEYETANVAALPTENAHRGRGRSSGPAKGTNNRVNKPTGWGKPQGQPQQTAERLQEAMTREEQYPAMRAPRSGVYVEVPRRENRQEDVPMGEEVRPANQDAGNESGSAPKLPRTKLAKL